MRLLAYGLGIQEGVTLAEFSKWILDIGDGKIKGNDDDDPFDIDIPDDILITDVGEPIKAIIHEVYGESYQKESDPSFFQGRAVLSMTNADVDLVNDYMLKTLEGEGKTYLSVDSIDISDTSSNNDMVYSQEFLNSIKISGLPHHNLKLKVGAIIILLGNIDPRVGLCNGTRMQITQLATHVIEARIITGNRIGEKVVLAKILVSPPDAKFPFRMRRRQFEIFDSSCFRDDHQQKPVTDIVHSWVVSSETFFTHGQLYVAVSRVTSRNMLNILITDKDGKPQKTTRNVVFT